MKQPDRFARMVEREATRQMAQGRWIWSAKGYTQVVERLLRAEHNAVVRLVKRECAGACECQEYILAALARRSR